jgi:hypothetical protein
MPDQATVLATYRDGVSALATLGVRLPDEAWSERVCGVWTATDLAGHVMVVAGWYHEWLDRAEAGATDPPFPSSELATRNQVALNGLEPEDGEGRLLRFRELALGYADRLPEAWDRPYGFPYGTVTAGQHAALAALEWHAHAWDLARGVGWEHRPQDPDGLFDAVGEAWPERLGRVRRTVVRSTLPLARATSRDRWALLLKNTGRVP